MVLHIYDDINQATARGNMSSQDILVVDLENNEHPPEHGASHIVNIIECGENKKEEIEKAFIDFIDDISSYNSSPYRWAGAVSEKNSFKSRLFERMFKLVFLAETIKKENGKEIIVLCKDKILCSQIRFNFGEKSDPGFYIRHVVNVFKGIVKRAQNAVAEYGKLIFVRRNIAVKLSEAEKGKRYTVIRSWIDSRNFSSEANYSDPYFKSLIGLLETKKIPFLVFGGIIGEFKKIIDRIKASDKDIIPVNYYLKGFDLIKCFLITVFKRPKFKRIDLFMGQNVERLILNESGKDIKDPMFFWAVMEDFCSMRLAENIGIDRFLYTYENYAWEKMSIKGLRAGNNDIRIHGFQHAFVAKNSFKYFPGKYEAAAGVLPDKIITMGRRTKEIMSRYGVYPEDKLQTGCALRQGYIQAIKNIRPENNKNIFVALTIGFQDTVKVFDFLYEAGMGEYEGDIYFRFHPVLSPDKVLNQLHFKVPGNFKISSLKTVEEEIRRAGLTLYTWTTVCLEALKMGSPVIYLDLNYPVQLDPLFECNHLKSMVRGPDELTREIKYFMDMNDDEYGKEYAKALEYLDEYFYPVNDQNMAAFL